jgi:AFG3 family protein
MFELLLLTSLLVLMICSEDMINLLGKRPFTNRSDDMDKWLDENQGGLTAPPPFGNTDTPEPSAENPMPSPAMIKALNMEERRPFQ